jgi:hypothetical protein
VSITWSDRDGDRELRILAPTQERLFQELTTAFAELVEGTEEGSPDRLPVLVEAAEGTSLAGEFVDDLLYLASVESFAAARLERLQINGNRLRAAVSGTTGPLTPPATYVQRSETRYDPSRRRWSATIIITRP